MQAEESKHKRKLERGVLGKSEQDLKQWLSHITQLKPYAEQFEDANVTGEAILAITSEAELFDCGVSIDVEVDKYCLLLNLARVRAHAREGKKPRMTDQSKAKIGKAKRPPTKRGGAALGTVEMEQVAQADSEQSAPAAGLVKRGVC